MSKIGPLDGIRVLELTNWMAAPGCGALLADMGADVVKVEPLTGDVVRNMSRPARPVPGGPNLDVSFHADNRGKRSIAIALDTPDGADTVRRLVATCDVFLCNLLPRRQRRFGLDPDTLKAIRPTLVHATLTGYGLDGPDAERPGFDVTTFFGRGAVTDSMLEPGGTAPLPRPAQGDHATSLALLAAILAALRVVERTGDGQAVDVSLLATAAWTMATDLAAVLVDGKLPTKRDREHRLTPLGTSFRCSDDRWIILNMVEPRWWPKFCESVDHPEWITDERFGSVRDRYDHMPELSRLLDDLFATRTLDGWAELCDRKGLIWGPAATLAELANDPQAAATGMFPTIDTPEGTIRTIAAPMHVAGADIRPRGPAPTVGQHTTAVLRDAGFTTDEIDALADSGAIGVPTNE